MATRIQPIDLGVVSTPDCIVLEEVSIFWSWDPRTLPALFLPRLVLVKGRSDLQDEQ
jgi:hypothetical protein